MKSLWLVAGSENTNDMLIDFRQLFPRYGIKPKGVLHVGANVGEERDVYLELGIKNQTWFEANPHIFQILESNIKNNAYAHAHNICLGDEDKDTILHISNNHSQSSSVFELGTHKIAHPEVSFIDHIPMKMRRLDSLYDGMTGPMFYCDFLNIDVQGAELKVLIGMGKLLDQFKWAYLEVNWEPLYIGCALFSEICEYMASFGFKVAEYKKCGSTGWGDCLFIK